MPYQEHVPHAPMPGAPPYPPAKEHPPPPVGPAGRTGYPKALGATAVWALVNLVLVLAVTGPPPSAEAFGGLVGTLLFATLLAALPVWAIRRRRATSMLLLTALALPFFVVLRVITNLPGT